MKKWKEIARDYCSPFVHASSYFLAVSKIPLSLINCEEEWVVEYKDGVTRMCVEVETMHKKGQLTLEKLKEKQFFERVSRENASTIKALEKYGYEVNSLDAGKLSNDELFMRYKKLFDLWLEMNLWGHVVNLADFEHFLLSNTILAFLEKRVKENNARVTSAGAFSILITPKRSKLQQQDFDFYTVLEKVQKGEDIQNGLKQHAYKYKWLQFHYDGPTTLNEHYFFELLKSEDKQGVNASDKLGQLKTHEDSVKQEQLRLTQELKLNEQEKHLIEVAKEFAFLKGLRKETVFETSCNTFNLVREIAKRLQITPRQVRFMLLSEVQKSLKTSEVDLEELNKRTKFCVQRNLNGEIHLYTGKEAVKLAAMIYEDEAAVNLTQVKGTPAFPGLVKGEVKIVNQASDMEKFKKGDILVSPATNPNLVAIMKIAGAIITNEGGITCHAAIVSRELKVPCVIGTKVATKWLKDGDLVEVDAETGIVKKLS